jgi:D-proline reductase (dithiol) PrdB
MEPIKYVDALNEHYGSMGFPPYKWTVNDVAPLHRPNKPLNESTVSILVSGGISQCTMPGFDPEARNDHRVDAIDNDVSSADFQIHDAYYDHSDAERDINCVFPIDRLREMAAAGEIDAVAPRLWSGFMGRIYNRTRVLEETGPAFVEKLNEDGVDILLAVPA